MVFDSNQGIPLGSPRLTKCTKQKSFNFVYSESKTYAYGLIQYYFSIIVN